MPIPIRRLRPAPTTLLAALCLIGGPLTVEAQEHTLHVAVADAQGNPVPGLSEDDIVVQWDGVNLETTEFEAIDWPVRLTVFVDNGGTAANLVPQVREGLRALLRELPAEVEIAMLTTSRQPRWITGTRRTGRSWRGTSPTSLRTAAPRRRTTTRSSKRRAASTTTPTTTSAITTRSSSWSPPTGPTAAEASRDASTGWWSNCWRTRSRSTRCFM